LAIAIVGTTILALLLQVTVGLRADAEGQDGLDLTNHGEAGQHLEENSSGLAPSEGVVMHARRAAVSVRASSVATARSPSQSHREHRRGRAVLRCGGIPMAGVDIDVGTRARRRSLDSDVNMIPMIDLMMVTICFLLITAAWSHMARLDADAQVPGPHGETPGVSDRQLHVEMRAQDRFVLLWKQGHTTLESIDVPRHDVVTEDGPTQVVRFPDLAARIESEWRTKGQHVSPTDARSDQAVIHTDNDTQFKYIVGVIDAVRQAKRERQVGAKSYRVPALRVAFAVD
jgi:biopolymer transport protein ExbD